MQWRLAWRNIWRNRRRTFITAASVMFAVLLATLMEGLQRGSWDHMINNVVNYYYSFVQVHSNGYWEEQSIDKAFPLDEELVHKVEQIDEVLDYVPRIESFALAASEDYTSGALVIGSDLEREDNLSGLKGRISAGEYVSSDETSILVAEGLAAKLKLGLGDTMVLISQGYHGVNSAGKYHIKGLVHLAAPELNRQIVFVPLKEAQWFYGAEGLITSLALKIADKDDVEGVVKSLNQTLDTTRFEVTDWQEMIPDLMKAKSLDSAGNMIVYFILYIVIAFGIFGTLLMMVKERQYEFGVLISIGMKRGMLTMITWLEILMIAFLGAVAGILLSLPVVGYFHVRPIRLAGQYAVVLEEFGFEPIFPASMDWGVFGMQAVWVFAIVLIMSIYPFRRIRRLEPVEAMRP